MEPGDVVEDRFVIEAQAGVGGMGAVYRAHDRTTGGLAALKVVADESSAKRFAQEASVLGELAHPRIVRYVTHGETDRGEPFLAMEWLEGEDLATRLERGPLSVQNAITLALQVADALAAAHARGILHRDIKPANLFLERGDASSVKVLDFGIARFMRASGYAPTARPLTKTGAVVGTIGYMAPEQARGERELDARADVFALGCVLFECLTGRPAFVGDHLVAVLAKILLDEAPRVSTLLPDVPRELDDLVAKMLAKDVWSRPANGSEVHRALASVTDVPSSEVPPPRSQPALADREQRLATIVLARVEDVAAARALSEGFGGEVFVLAEGSLVVSFRAVRGATDQVARAASCALAMAPTALGVAIATGRIETTGEGFVGPIVDRVASLFESVPRGVVTVDAISAGLLEGRFDVRNEGGAFVLHGALRGQLAPRTLLGRVTPCVGREKELALLEATYRECAAEPIARAVLVTGVPGTGKTRLVHELLDRLKLGPEVTVLVARGDPVGAGSAMMLARQLVRSAARMNEASDPKSALEKHLRDRVSAEACEMLAELAGIASETPGPQLRAARNDPAIMSSAMRHALEEWAKVIVASATTLVVLEDVHWGDAASVALIGEALVAQQNKPLMVIALARPEVHDLFPRLWSAAGVQEIRLGGLTRSACERLIKSAMPDASGDRIQSLVARADGNAFYLEELVRHAIEREAETLPGTVLALVQSRLEGLAPETRRFLRVASIFGEVFSKQGVEALAEGTGADTALRALVDREVLVPATGDGKFAFRHSLLRDAAYAMLTDEDRAAGHRLAGEWLERSGGSDALALADHFERANEPRRAAVHLARAAQDAVSAGEMAGALALAEKGQRFGAEGETLGKLLLAKSLALGARGELAEGAKVAHEARALLPHGSTDWFVALAGGLSAGVRVNDFSMVPTAITELLALEVEPPPSGAYGFAVHMLVDILDTVDQSTIGRQILERAERIDREHPNVDPLFSLAILQQRASFSYRRDADVGYLYSLLLRFESLMRLIPHGALDAWLPLIRGIVDLELGRAELAAEAFAETIAAHERAGANMWAGWGRLHRSWALLFLDRDREAIGIVEALFESPDARHAKLIAAFAHYQCNRLDEAERLIDEVVDGIDHELLPPWLIHVAHVTHGMILFALGRPADALAAVPWPKAESAWCITHKTMHDTLLVECALALGDEGRAKEVAAEARVRFDRHVRSLDGHPELRASFLAQRWNQRLLDSLGRVP